MRLINKIMRPINKVIIHCSATPEGRDVKMEEIKSWHTDKGWSDIGYHYIIELDGSVKSGRPVEIVGAHCLGQNKFSIGVCYVGGVDDKLQPKDTRTDEQKSALVKLINKLKKKHKDITIHAHNEFSNKACPSFNVADEGY